jgi:NAD-dependent SIR2 family protein deacetylase
MTEVTRYAISTGEEVWVRACYKFFEEHGFYNWYQVPVDKAYLIVMKHTRGQANPFVIRQRVDQLYKDAGVRYDET